VLYSKNNNKQTLSQEDRKTTGLLFIAATNIATAQQLYVETAKVSTWDYKTPG
jgi:hypothetical protein